MSKLYTYKERRLVLSSVWALGLVLGLVGLAEADLGADPAVLEALASAALTPADFGQRTDYEPRDPFRLPLVEALLARPLAADSVVAHLTRELAPDRPLSALVEAVAGQLGLAEPRFGVPREQDAPAADFWMAHGRLLRAQASVRKGVAEAFAGLTEAERDTLVEGLAPLLLEDPELGEVHPVELRALRLAEDTRASQLFALAARVRREALLAAGVELARAVEAFLAAVKGTTGFALQAQGDSQP